MRFSYFELTEQNRETRTLLKSGSELRCSATVGNFCSSSGTRRVERTGKGLRQVGHIRGHFLHRCSITVTQVMVATVNLSKWCLQL